MVASFGIRPGMAVVALAVGCPSDVARTGKPDTHGTPVMHQDEEPSSRPRSPAQIRKAGNHLVGEPSPYLRQHDHNPVDWYPFGAEALKKAQREGKPIFLSIGYATCHWCHVMEHESFEDDQVAAFLNEHFVSIKVDREQRPDLDAIYIDAVGAMGGSTGWPLTVFLTPDLEPFFGGTYYPRRGGGGRPGFMDVLRQVHRQWTDQGEAVAKKGREILQAVEQQALAAGPPTHVTPALVVEAFQRLLRARDLQTGGFGNRQKFPNTPLLRAHLLFGERTGDADTEAHLARTLDHMRRGGVRDHLAGTFHRYAMDRAWHVPHFEKTLYDNAQLAELYVEAGLLHDRPAWVEVGRSIADDLLATWQRDDGGFMVGFDADDPKGEGHYYTWTPAELEEALGAELARVVATVYGVTEEGEPMLDGRSVLHRISDDEARSRLNLSAEKVQAQLLRAHPKMLAARRKRPPPAADDKELVAWNALTVMALSNLGRWLEEPRYVEAARRAGVFIMDRNFDRATGVMQRGQARGEALGEGFLDDYALTGLALLRLHAATGEDRWLKDARAVGAGLIRGFWDPERRVFYQTRESRAGATGPVRLADMDDGVLPGGGSAGIRFALELGAITGDRALHELGEQALEQAASRLTRSPYSSGYLLATLEHALRPVREVVIATGGDAAGAAKLWEVVRTSRFARILPVRIEGETAWKGFPALEGKVARGGQATAYVCELGRCQTPTADPAVLARQLADVSKR